MACCSLLEAAETKYLQIYDLGMCCSRSYRFLNIAVGSTKVDSLVMGNVSKSGLECFRIDKQVEVTPRTKLFHRLNIPSFYSAVPSLSSLLFISDVPDIPVSDIVRERPGARVTDQLDGNIELGGDQPGDAGTDALRLPGLVPGGDQQEVTQVDGRSQNSSRSYRRQGSNKIIIFF